MTVERKEIRELTDREKQLLAPEVKALFDANEELEEARERFEARRQRLVRLAQLLHEPASDDDVVNLDLDRMVLYRTVEETEEASSEP